MNKKILGVVFLLLIVVVVSSQFKLSSGETVKAYMETLERGEPKEAQKYISSFKMGKIKELHGDTDEFFEKMSKGVEEKGIKSIEIIKEREGFKMEINDSVYPWASADVKICYSDECTEGTYSLIREDGMWKLY